MALTMLFLVNFNSSSFSFDGGVKQLVRMISIHLSSEIHRSRYSGCFVVSDSKAVAIHFVVEVFDVSEITMSAAKIIGHPHAANAKCLPMAWTKNFQVRCVRVSMIVMSGDSCGGSIIVAIEASLDQNLAHLGAKPEMDGSEATCVELLPRATQMVASAK